MALKTLRQIRNGIIATALAVFIGAGWASLYLFTQMERVRLPIWAPIWDGWAAGIDEGWIVVILARFLLGFGLSWLPLATIGVLVARKERSGT